MPDELSPLEWLRSALMDWEELVEVRPTPNLPDGTAALIFDPNAIKAATRQALQRAEHARVALRREAFERELRRDHLWAASLNYPPDPRSAVIITGI